MSLHEEPRIPPRPFAEWGDDVHDAMSLLSGRPVGRESFVLDFGSNPVPGLLGIFAWHPALTKAWLTFSSHLATSTLPDRTREMLILRVCWLRDGEFEWIVHAKFGLALGISEAEIEAIKVGPDHEVWSRSDAAILRSVDEVCVDRYISDTTWQTLAEKLDRQQLMDLVFTIGAYDLHAMAFNTFGLELDPGLEAWDRPPLP